MSISKYEVKECKKKEFTVKCHMSLNLYLFFLAKSETYVDKFLLDESNRLAYCHFPKVASTSIFKIFGRLLGLSKQDVDNMDKHSVRDVWSAKFQICVVS